MQALISHIARCSFVDGPGIRTTVFMKGCPLDCSWCQNPETISFYREQFRDSMRCIQCLNCLNECDEDAISFDGDFQFEPDKCINCRECEQNCPTQTLKLNGYHLNAEQLLELLLRDREYYEISEGGVTFSGGEPLMHMVYLEPVLRGLKERDIHIAVQTAGFFNFDQFMKSILKHIDLIYYDLKILDRENHKIHTGKYNDLIISNLLKLSEAKFKRIIVRTPLIPGITDTEENLAQIKSFLKGLNIDNYELLPFNPVGKAAYIPTK